MSVARKASKSAKRRSGGSKAPKYSPRASASVETELHAMKEHTLTAGKSGTKVTDPKQAIAIGLSKARKEGAKVPAPPTKSAAK